MTLGPAFGRSLARLLSAALLPASIAGFVSVSAAAPVAAAGGCQLNSLDSAVKHVIEVQFDNVHLTRDNPSVPSDLEQMPNLLNFLKDNGMLSSNHHTPLISHTADDIIRFRTVTASTRPTAVRRSVPARFSTGPIWHPRRPTPSRTSSQRVARTLPLPGCRIRGPAVTSAVFRPPTLSLKTPTT